MNENNISPVPYQEQIISGSLAAFTWLEWFRQLRDFIVGFNAYKTYGLFSCNINQSPVTINTPKAIPFDSQPISSGITYTGSKIIVPYAGLYQFTFTCQITSTSASAKNLWFWPRVNGVDIAGSTIKTTRTNNNGTGIITRSGLFRLEADDYLEAWWAADDLAVQLSAFSATSFAPATPAAVLEVLQIG